MTQEEKDLLLKDLCARLPYGVMIEITSDGGIMEASYDMRLDAGLLADLLHSEDDFKSYLRPMSSMTEEEKKEWHKTFDSVYDLVPGGDPDNEDDYDDNWHEQPGIESYDYLIAHHFDYRGLIPKGLALEAPEDMYKSK